MQVVFINEAVNGGLDLDDLERKLKVHSILRNEKRVKIGSFVAASNITGILLPVEKIATMLHRYGFLSFWDYATAAPHVEIDMNPVDENEPYVTFLLACSLASSNSSASHRDGHLGYKDAVFLSVHKFIGGPQTPVNEYRPPARVRPSPNAIYSLFEGHPDRQEPSVQEQRAQRMRWRHRRIRKSTACWRAVQAPLASSANCVVRV